jgi:hypothetical protein
MCAKWSESFALVAGRVSVAASLSLSLGAHLFQHCCLALVFRRRFRTSFLPDFKLKSSLTLAADLIINVFFFGKAVGIARSFASSLFSFLAIFAVGYLGIAWGVAFFAGVATATSEWEAEVWLQSRVSYFF